MRNFISCLEQKNQFSKVSVVNVNTLINILDIFLFNIKIKLVAELKFDNYFVYNT